MSRLGARSLLFSSLLALACTERNPLYEPKVDGGRRDGPRLDAPSDVAGTGGQGGFGGQDGEAGQGGAGGVPDLASADSGDAADEPAPEVMPEAPAPPDAAPDVIAAEPAELDRALVGWWTFDETTGATCNDSSASNLDGTVTGAARLTTGLPTLQSRGNLRALNLRGTGQYVTIPPRTGLLPAVQAPKSIAFWMSTSDQSAGMHNIISLVSGTDSGIQVGTRDGWLSVWQWGEANSGLIESVSKMTMGWRHVVYTFDGTWHRLYLDGVEEKTGGRTRYPEQRGPVTSFMLGTYYELREYYVGYLDELRIYDRVLNRAEIAALAAGG